MNSPFNPLQYVRQLEDAGVPNNQAEVHANTLAKVLDNYAQLQELKQEVTTAVAASEFRVRAEIVELQAQLKAEIADVAAKSRAEIAEAMAGLRAEIAEAMAGLRGEIAEAMAEFRAEIAEAEARLRAEIAEAEARLRTEFNTRMDKLEAKMQGLRRTNAIIIALAVAILAQGYFK